MPDYRPPALPTSIAVEYFSLSVRGDVEIPSGHLKRVREASGQDADEPHLSFRAPVALGDHLAEVWGLVGIHTSIRRDADAEQRELSTTSGEQLTGTFEVHYELILRTSDKASSRGAVAAWDNLSGVLQEVLPPHSAQVQLLLVAGRDELEFPVTVPIPLNTTDVPGFSEIRGFRLVQPDPQDPDAELYYAIVDRSGDQASIQVHAPTEARWNSGILEKCMRDALAIVDLATRQPEPKTISL